MVGLGRPVAFANRASQGARRHPPWRGADDRGARLFATLVTRAGGAWASSVHTFVVDAEGSSPPDAFGRIVALAVDAGPGIEVMAYLLVLLTLVGWWLADVAYGAGLRRMGRTLAADLAVPSLVAVAVLLETSSALWLCWGCRACVAVDRGGAAPRCRCKPARARE